MAMVDLGKILITPKGEYNPSTTYEFLDVITYQGSSYLVTATSFNGSPVVGITPSDDINTPYMLLARVGDKGDQGNDGKDGIDGKDGLDGADAVTDQVYNAMSTHAQSGVAVAQAVSGQEKTFNKVSVIEKEYIDNNTYPSTEAVYNFVGATVKTGTDVEPVPLYSLATGIYIINGPYQLKMGMSGYREGYGSLVYVYEYAAEIDRVSYTLLVIIDRERITRYYVNTHDFIWIDTVSIEELCDAQVLSNKTTVINSDSTDTEYPSAKAVHTAINETVGDINAVLAELVSVE